MAKWLGFFIILLLSFSAYAESVSLTVQQARDLFQALNALDGHEKVVKDGANEKVVRVSYTFGGGVRLAIGRNLVALSPTVQAYDKSSRDLFVQMAAGKDKLEGEAMVKYQIEAQSMLDQKITTELIKLKPAELKLDPPENNPIPGSVISGLQPILDQ